MNELFYYGLTILLNDVWEYMNCTYTDTSLSDALHDQAISFS